MHERFSDLLTDDTGLGRGLVAGYLARPGNTVIAAVRDPEHNDSTTLKDLSKGERSSMIVVKIDSESESDAQKAASDLSSVHGVSAIDVIIANAGISKVLPTVIEAKSSDLIEHFRVNAIATVLLFQAFRQLLLRSSQKYPKFVTMSTSAATIEDMEQRNFPNSAYGTSKAALNYLTKKIHLENEEITAFPISPG